MTNITCTWISETDILCNGLVFHEDEKLYPQDTMFWGYLGIYCGLVLGAGLMSGLTIGLLSLDLLSLKVLSESGSGNDTRYAKRLFPIIRRHHWLLVTLLLGNAACVEAMPIFLDRISDPVTAILVSVTAVLFFGEVIPQALCTRFGLAIGYYCSPIVMFVMAALCPIAWPISVVLDCILGKDHEIVFKKEELKSLMGFHGPRLRRDEQGNVLETDREASGVEDNQADKIRRTVLTRDEAAVIRGALEMSGVVASEVCTKLDDVFMLSDSDSLTDRVRLKIAACAHSRIPIYHGDNRNDIRGVFLVKMLLVHFISPAKSEVVTIQAIMEDKKCFRNLPFVDCQTSLYDLLNIFQQGKSHMAVVLGDQVDGTPNVIGVITLEDILERLLLEPIQDEADEIRAEVTSRLRRSVRKSRQVAAAASGMTTPRVQRLTSVATEKALKESLMAVSRAGSDTERSPLLDSEVVDQYGSRQQHGTVGPIQNPDHA